MKELDVLNYMVLNFVIFFEKFWIIMYNVKEDVLLCSYLINLFDFFKKLSSKVIVVIWMVLYYWCFGFKSNEVN